MGFDISFRGAILAGLISFASPCVLPIVPPYLCFLAGVSLEDPAKGAEIVGTKKLGNCISCHEVSELSDVPWQGNVGPVLDGAADRWTEAELRGLVANAKNTFDGTVMPSFYKVAGFIRPGDAYTGKAAKAITPLLSAQQVEDVVAFLQTLKE